MHITWFESGVHRGFKSDTGRPRWHPVAERVGFGRRFGVKLAVPWAVERGLPIISDGSKLFK
jgi:hypothetical protein